VIYIELILFSSFGIVAVLYQRHLINFAQTEMGYVVLSFVAKTLLLWLAVGGSISERQESPSPIEPVTCR
jgi:hypothetical protein